MSLVLYRRYRPQSFKDFIGQKYIIKTLTNATSRDMISHAYLFSGPRGTGKTTLARLLAKAVNCQNKKEGEFEPCNKCSSCLEIMGGQSMDLIEIDAASHRGIDDIRELKEGVRFAPTKSKYKVFIIDESHQLTKDGANALLKTLEEPPEHAIFILATTEAHKMIPTIISRCQRFDFKRLTISEIVEKLEKIAKKEGIKIQKNGLELIASNSEGAIRDAEGLLSQLSTFYKDSQKDISLEDIKSLLGLIEISIVSSFVDFLYEKKMSDSINYINEINNKGLDLEEFTKSLINYLRKILVTKIIGEESSNQYLVNLTKEEVKHLQEQAKSFTNEELRNILNIFLEAQNKMKYSPIPQLPLELGVVEICGIV